MEPSTAFESRHLDRRDVNSILARNITGRIAFATGREIEILPVTYVHAGNEIYLRSSASGRIATTNPSGTRVGFEVDEIQSTQRWRSVVVHGTMFRVERETEYEEWMRGVGKLRRLMPDALRDADNLGHRSMLFRIVIDDATGRAMS
jgi:nitroimidazol reductase NimA-like FMN-containing flavoprotein (pyridoxamine 5'-phosphate oxidase superfamily)